MKIRSERDRRNYIIVALCMVLVIMGVGYAAFSSLLTINGTANISNSWCLGFDNTKTNTMNITKGVSTGTTPTGSMSYSGTACGTNLQPVSSLASHFYQPGDEIEYTLTITNKSTVTAAIKSILVDNESVTSNTTKKKDNITYIVEMPEDTTLSPNASTTMKVIAKFQNETDVTGPYSGETKTIEVKINALEDDGNGGMEVTEPKFTGSIYRWSNVETYNGDSIATDIKNVWCAVNENEGYNSCDEENEGYDEQSECLSDIDGWEGATCEQGTITTGIGDYTTDVSTLNKNYYLKHDIVNDIITDSYVCFVYNNAEHCMKGGIYEEESQSKPVFDTNVQIIDEFKTFYNLPNSRCSNEIIYSCDSFNDFNRVYTWYDGSAGVVGLSTYDKCSVEGSSRSFCGLN